MYVATEQYLTKLCIVYGSCRDFMRLTRLLFQITTSGPNGKHQLRSEKLAARLFSISSYFSFSFFFFFLGGGGGGGWPFLHFLKAIAIAMDCNQNHTGR